MLSRDHFGAFAWFGALFLKTTCKSKMGASGKRWTSHARGLGVTQWEARTCKRIRYIQFTPQTHWNNLGLVCLHVLKIRQCCLQCKANAPLAPQVSKNTLREKHLFWVSFSVRGKSSYPKLRILLALPLNWNTILDLRVWYWTNVDVAVINDFGSNAVSELKNSPGTELIRTL